MTAVGRQGNQRRRRCAPRSCGRPVNACEAQQASSANDGMQTCKSDSAHCQELWGPHPFVSLKVVRPVTRHSKRRRPTMNPHRPHPVFCAYADMTPPHPRLRPPQKPITCTPPMPSRPSACTLCSSSVNPRELALCAHDAGARGARCGCTPCTRRLVGCCWGRVRAHACCRTTI